MSSEGVPTGHHMTLSRSPEHDGRRFRNRVSESGRLSAPNLLFELSRDQLTHGNSIPVEQGNWAGQGRGGQGGVFLESPPVAGVVSSFRPKGGGGRGELGSDTLESGRS